MVEQKNVRKMSRKELLEVLVLQSRKIDFLEEELAKKDKVISDRKILLKESGSIAEASLRLNDIFKIAQDSADDYLKSIEAMKIKEEKLLQKLEKEKAKLTKSKSKKEKNKDIKGSFGKWRIRKVKKK